MNPRTAIAAATLAIAALALAGCVEPAQPTPEPTSTTAPTPTVAPEPTPTPSTVPVPEPEPTTPPAPGALDAGLLVEAVGAKDAATAVAQLGSPIHVVDTLRFVDASRSADVAVGDLDAVIGFDESFQLGDASDTAAVAASAYPEFGGADAVVFVGSRGTRLSFIPNGFLALAP